GAAARSSVRTPARTPPKRPTGVRTPSQRKASGMVGPLVDAMGLRGPRVELAQHGKLVRRWRRCLDDVARIADRPARTGLDPFARHARMNGHHRHFSAVRIRFEDAKIGDELGGALRPKPESLTVVAAFAVAERRDKIKLVHKAAPGLIH